MERARTIETLAKVEAAQENERLKSVLLDSITHDFKTPLTSIKGSATGLLSNLEFNREQQRELLLIIDEECDLISRLIGEASEMARLETGLIKVEATPHAAEKLISETLAERKNLIDSRPIVRVVKDPGTRVVLSDMGLAKKVLLHLIDNANLYSTEGEPITISAEAKDGFAEFRVADIGPGIDEAEAGQIFEKFYRGKEQRHRVPGTGMGLAIAKAIVEAHSGTIGVVSRVGQGSTFIVRLPLATSPDALSAA